ncbi:MAG: M48 family metallopeptidase [Clostridia bacterium]|nr:M48 family metallopeptidase [Clostridia bacterium]
MAKRKQDLSFERSVCFGKVSAQCTFTPKKVKNINIRVRPDGRVSVSYPLWLTADDAVSALMARADFVASALNRRPAPPEEKTLLYHGRPLILRAEYAPTKELTYSDGILTLAMPDFGSPAAVAKAAEEWLSDRCRLELTGICMEVYRLFGGRVPFPEIHFKKMTSRWGSCLPQKKVISLNTALISVPESCAQYVVVHEFAHFLHPNHSPAFHDAVESLLPDAKARKKLLNTFSL